MSTSGWKILTRYRVISESIGFTNDTEDTFQYENNQMLFINTMRPSQNIIQEH